MKRSLLAALVGLLALMPWGTTSTLAGSPVVGKVIALDAGHGGSELGATYPANAGPEARLFEKDLNLDTAYALKDRLVAAGALVVLTREGDETIASRRERVDIAIAKCTALAGRSCDALVSVHHNGSTDPAHDGLLVIYNERRDLALARAVHDSLLARLRYPPGGTCTSPYTFRDEGLLNGGYGMTVYGHLVSIITEAYYLTNDCEGGYLYPRGSTNWRGRVSEEAAALFSGIESYFGASGCKRGKC